MTGQVVGGLDGCAAGWVLVTVPAHEATVPEVTALEVTVLEVTVLADLGPVMAALESGRMAATAIDIPIGLPPLGPRA